jgi:phospholipase C
MHEHTRREFFRRAAILGGAAGAAQLLPQSIQKALAIDPAPGSTFLDAEHVVILMQENRSFDHSYGSLQGVRGFNDPRAITLPNGNPVWVQTDSDGKSYVPFRLNIKDTRSTWMGCLPHGWTDQVDARNEGRYDRWLPNKRSGEDAYAAMPLTMGHYTRADIPFYYELADAFTICDQNFCSSLTGTTPNRLHLWTGTIRAQQSTDSPALVLNSNCDYNAEVSWPTFPDRLEDHGVSWKIYQNEVTVPSGLSEDQDAWLSNFGDSPLEWFTQFNVRFAASRRQYVAELIEALQDEIETLEHKQAAGDLSADAAARLAMQLAKRQAQLGLAEAERNKYSDETFAALPEHSRNLHAKAFTTNAADPSYRELTELSYQDGPVERALKIPKGDLLYQFRQDVLKDELPAVSWIVPPQKFSDHPSSAWYGAWYIAELLDILTQNPDVWRKTIFILTYDENDGYFDHVPPFVAPHPQRPETGRVSPGVDASLEYVEREQEMRYKPPGECRDSSIGLGYRVPLVIASPWTRGGCVCSQVFDHTSSLQFMEKWLSHKTGRPVREPNVNSWRRTVCGDLSSAFQPQAQQNVAKLPFPPRDEFLAGIHQAQFKELPSGFAPLTPADIEQIRRGAGALSLLPRQEPGMRRSCSLPYELAVDGALADDGKSFDITLAAGNTTFGERAAGAPFVVYARYGGDNVQTRNYAVAPGDRLNDAWPLADFADGRYRLAAYGPNGFFREFRGDGDDAKVSVELHERRARVGADALTGDVEVRLINRDETRTHIVEIRDVSYGNRPVERRLAPGESAACVVNSQRTFGWYDLSIRIADCPDFEKRYAGRVETGAWSYTDPAMGRVVV